MPQSIPKGLTAEHVLLAIADLDSGIDHPFGSPTGYEHVHDGRHYPPKAVIGLAFRHLIGSILPPEAFSGGEAPGQANYVLRGLGFGVEKKGETTEPDARVGWSEEEVRLIVADYFDMFRLDLHDRPFSKAEHNRSLRELLNCRSKGSVEFKHQNISAVLLDCGMPYLDGYKPARNYQKRVLPQVVEEYLDAHPEIHKLIEASPVLNPKQGANIVGSDPMGVLDDPPDRMTATTSDSKQWRSRKGRKVDYARRDAVNRELGRLGEEFSLELERQRQLAVGRDDLAARVD